MKTEKKFETIFHILDDLFPSTQTNEQQSDPKNSFTINRKYPKTRKHKKIENLKNEKQTLNEPREKTFYENLVCKNESCVSMNQTKHTQELNSVTLENILLDLQQTRIFSKYPPQQVADGLTSYILYVLIETNPLDLVGEKMSLKKLNIFLLDLSKYVTEEITSNLEEKIDYYYEILQILKEKNNLAAIESILSGIKNCRLSEKDFKRIADFEIDLRNEEEAIFLNNENSLPSIRLLLNKLSEKNNSEEFIFIIEYFSNIKESKYDEDIEYDIYRTLEDFTTNLNQRNKEYSSIYFDLIKYEI